MKARIGASRLRIIVLAAVVVSCAAGCGTSKRDQLEAVAKDWSMVIRASQVIPVYPLTEDIQPGDVFLVQVPIDRQQELYREKGYLALDNHVARLDPARYDEFYSHSFSVADGSRLPRDWMRPKPAVGAGEPIAAWMPAPRAAFPSYSFSVRRGVGLNLAVPVSGVPVGLSLLGSDAADGNINIKQARSIGIDTISMFRQLETWARENRDFLRNFEPRDDRTNFLRIVTRVYVTGALEVTLSDSARVGGGLDAGAPKPVDLLTATAPTGTGDVKPVTIEDYSKNIETLNKALAAETLVTTLADGTRRILPGGSLRVTAASSRSISMSETFESPLVLGYLGFDCAIAEGGFLGRPIPTQSVIDEDLRDALQPADMKAYLASTYRVNTSVYQALAPMGDAAKPYVEALDALVAFVPDTLTHYSDARAGLVEATADAASLKRPTAKPFVNFHAYLGLLERSIESLRLNLERETFDLVRNGAATRVDGDSPLRAELTAALARLQAMRDDPRMTAAYSDAAREAVAFYAENQK